VERLLTHLKPLQRDGIIDLWVDQNIQPGARWQEEIETALNTAKVAVLVITADFLASDFITNNELPILLEASEKDGAIIIPLILKASRFAHTDLVKFQSANPASKPLIGLPESEQEEILVKLSETIETYLRQS